MPNNVELLLNSQCALGEGVMWHAQEQALYWVDILRQTLWRYTPDTAVQACWHMPQMVTAVLPTTSNKLLLTLAEELSLFDPDTLSLQTVCHPGEDGTQIRLNDATLDAAGDVWFGSMDLSEESPIGAFYHYARNELTALLHGITITNGPAFSCDGNDVFFTDTVGRTIFRASVSAGTPAHTLEHAEPFITLVGDEGYPDGMCTDTQGGLWVAHWGAGCVSRYEADGTLDLRITLPVSNVTKCCFGGSTLNTLYITTARKGLSAQQLIAEPAAGAVFCLATEFQGVALTPYPIGNRTK